MAAMRLGSVHAVKVSGRGGWVRVILREISGTDVKCPMSPALVLLGIADRDFFERIQIERSCRFS